MAVSVTINGSSYSFPATGDENWGDSVTQWAQAVSLHLLQKTGGTFTLSSDVNFGASFGLKSLYYKTLAANVSNSGAMRLGNSEGFGWRNAANTADLLISVDTGDLLNFNGTPIAFPVALGAADTVNTSNGTIPVWKLLDNANIAAAAAVARTKIASGTNDHVVINDGSGVLSSEVTLSPVRGGSGIANNAAATLTRSGNFALTLTTTATTNVTLPTSGTLATTQAIAAGYIAARYVPTGTITVTSSLTVVNFATQTYDSNSAVTTGAAWKFTVPSGGDGKYRVTAKIILDTGGGWAAAEFAGLTLYKNGAAVSVLAQHYAQASNTTYVSINGSDTISLVATDYIDVRAVQTSGANLNLFIGALDNNFITIERVGP